MRGTVSISEEQLNMKRFLSSNRMESTTPIVMNDFRAQWEEIGQKALSAVDRVGKSGWLILGREVEDFERQLARQWGISYCVGCASGLDAIEIALKALGAKPGDKVLTTPLSAFATTLAIVRAGCIPVFVDVEASGLIDLDLCADVLESDRNVRFLVPVHLFGHAIDLTALRAVRDRFEIQIIEDCAQAIGARSSGTAVGSVGGAAATSFYPTKNLGCMGDGGALLSGNPETAALARCLRDYGQEEKYRHACMGMNSRLDELQAAILKDALLPLLAGFTERRRSVANRYIEGIRNPAIIIPKKPVNSESVWHLFPLIVSGNRDAFQAHLKKAGIASGIHYPILIPDQEAMKSFDPLLVRGELPNARHFAGHEVSLPIHPYLTGSEIDRVILACNSWRQ